MSEETKPQEASEATAPDTPVQAEAAAAAQPEETVEAKAADETPAATEATEAPEATEATEATEAEEAEKKARQARNASLFRAYRSNRAVEGRIEQAIKGGYEVRVGKVRGFCPQSQIGIDPTETADSHVGKSYLFRILQVRRGGSEVVLSRRALLEEDRKEEAKAVRATLIEDSVMQGRVAGVAEFGAFVDLGAGVMGLVHISELSHGRVTKVDEAVKPGDVVTVRILKIDEDKGRISLSIRKAQQDPWLSSSETYKIGQAYPGKVQRLTSFGAFVELAPGLEALAPASEFPPSRVSWRERLEPGSTHDWLILSVDPAQRRISLTPSEGADGPLPELVAGAEATGKVQRVERFGVFIWLGPGRVGLIPKSWTGVKNGQSLERGFPIGDAVEVEIIEVSDDGRRIRLAKKGCHVKLDDEAAAGDRRPRERRPSRARRDDNRSRVPATPASDVTGVFGQSLADKLRAALDK